MPIHHLVHCAEESNLMARFQVSARRVLYLKREKEREKEAKGKSGADGKGGGDGEESVDHRKLMSLFMTLRKIVSFTCAVCIDGCC